VTARAHDVTGRGAPFLAPPGPDLQAIRAALLPEDVDGFDQEFRAVMAEATASMDLSGVAAFLERWRRVAWSSADPDGHRAMLGGAGQLLAGQHVPTTPWAETQSTLGL
jgi:uncharacterized protein DUF6247